MLGGDACEHPQILHPRVKLFLGHFRELRAGQALLLPLGDAQLLSDR